ncbi:hypothetical protein HYH03_002637 [Edaphochlamys debaryana]|uniref:Elongator complex protein 6 n=1 Tax=Edaphochlamys debaryana TaxID=47281 RepID=A0A835YDN6_9CHLO|nr:hypothetical protein HYH03_002637 [Edaphochlamys debaryana]|eukprot:KAG2499702.1 hypothetical protein HYH03_002637 [Edaphochlamys debaryana]
MSDVEFNRLAGSSLQGGLTLVKGSLQLSGLFVVQQYLRLFLKQEYAVVLVTAEQSLDHYKYTAKKLGLSLAQFQQTGHLVCVEPPTAPVPGSSDASGSAPSSERAGGAVGGGSGSRLQRLAAAVAAAVAQRPEAAAGCAVLVDSLTHLVPLASSRQEWSAFLHHCATAAAAPQAGQAQRPGCVVAGVYGDVAEDRPWLAALEHRANVVLELEPLPGRVADVDGVATATRRCGGGTALGCAAAAGPALGSSLQGAASAAAAPAPAGGWAPLRQSLYFRSTELAVRWMAGVTDRELL